MAYALCVLIFFISLLQFALTENSFKNFQVQFRKKYVNNSELLLREQIFAKNLEQIEQHNARFRQGLVTYEMGVNKFSDLTSEEFQAFLRAKESPLPVQEKWLESTESPPDSIDWRELGAVTEVKDQGICGACWAFSATGTLEGLYQQKYGELLSFSEQQLLDCDSSAVGCNGGIVQYALQYVAESGLKIGEEYPYVQEKLTCQNTTNQTVKVYTKNYVGIPSYNETELKKAVGLIGPISVAFDANLIQHYTAGIFDGTNCTNNVNHAVLAVGYDIDKESNTSYWLLKNSWGLDWGEEGYFRMTFSEDGKGLCGIVRQSCYPDGIFNSKVIDDSDDSDDSGGSVTTSKPNAGNFISLNKWIALILGVLLKFNF